MKYFLYRLSTLKLHAAAVTLFSLLSYPVLCAAVASYEDAYAGFRDIVARYGQDGNEYYAALDTINSYDRTASLLTFTSVIALGLLFVSGFFILRKCFRYLYDTDAVDMHVSLPETTLTKFLGDFFSGLCVYVVPHIVSIFIGIAIIGGRELTYSRPFEFSRYLYQAMLIGLLSCIVFYCTTLVIFSACGRSGRNILMTVIMNIAVPVMLLMMFFLSYMYGYGLDGSTHISEIPDIFTASSAFGALFLFLVNTRSYNVSQFNVDLPYAVTAILYSAAAAVCAYIMIKHRRHERTGTDYAFRYSRHVFEAISILAVTLFTAFFFLEWRESPDGWRVEATIGIHGNGAIVLVLWLLSSFLMFCICERTKNNSGRARHRAARYFVTVLGSGVFALIAALSKGLYAPMYVPDVGEVQSARVYANIGAGISGRTDDIAALTELHREIIDTHEYVGTGTQITVTYILNDGRYIYRQYQVGGELTAKAYKVMYESGVVRDNYTIMKYPIYRFRFYEAEDDGKVEISTNGSQRDVRIPREVLQSALYADAEKMTYERLLREPCDPSFYVTVETAGSYNSFDIPPFFENTIELLEENGVMPSIQIDMSKALICKDSTKGGIVGACSSMYIAPDETLVLDDPEKVEQLLAMCSVQTMYENIDETYIIDVFMEEKGVGAGSIYSERFAVTEENFAEAERLILAYARTMTEDDVGDIAQW